MRTPEDCEKLAEMIRQADKLSTYSLAVFRMCGCCCAVDADYSTANIAEHLRHGNQSRTMPTEQAKNLLATSNCFHGIMRGPNE